jgi:hypothetical protein
MSVFKNIGHRLAYLVVGLVLTATGALLVYLEFKSNQQYPNYGWSSYPFIILILGLASIGVAVSKKKAETGTQQNDKPVS